MVKFNNKLGLMKNYVATCTMIKWAKCAYRAGAIYEVPKVTMAEACCAWAHVHGKCAKWGVRKYRMKRSVDRKKLYLKVHVLLH